MPISYHIDEQQGLINSTVSGAFSTTDTCGLFESLLKKLKRGGNWVEVVKFQDVSELRVRFEDIPKLSNMSQELRECGLHAVLMCAFDNYTNRLISGMRLFMQEVNLNIIIVDNQSELDENLSALLE